MFELGIGLLFWSFLFLIWSAATSFHRNFEAAGALSWLAWALLVVGLVLVLFSIAQTWLCK